jgi:hypothetical protein
LHSTNAAAACRRTHSGLGKAAGRVLILRIALQKLNPK